ASQYSAQSGVERSESSRFQSHRCIHWRLRSTSLGSNPGGLGNPWSRRSRIASGCFEFVGATKTCLQLERVLGSDLVEAGVEVHDVGGVEAALGAQGVDRR